MTDLDAKAGVVDLLLLIKALEEFLTVWNEMQAAEQAQGGAA